MKAREIFAPFRYENPEELRDTPRYCYVKTVLGYLEIDIRNLLYLTASVVSPNEVTEITEDVLNMALRVVERLPDYLMGDLLGSRYEEVIAQLFHLKVGPPEKPDGLQESTEEWFRTTRLLLGTVGPDALEIDLLRRELTRMFSSDGHIGKKAWTRFIESKVRVKRRKGRPRKAEYDLIHELRKGCTPESYGKLVRQIPSFDNINHADLLNRVKAAESYRKKKQY